MSANEAHFAPSGAGQNVVGALRFDSVAALHAALQKLTPAPAFFDWSTVSAVDSSAVALLLAARRAYPDALHQHLPAALGDLVTLYGVDAALAPR